MSSKSKDAPKKGATPIPGSQILIDRVVDSPNLTVFMEHEVIAIDGESRVEAIVIRDLKSDEEKRLKVGGVFVEIGLLPNSELTGRITKLNDLGEQLVFVLADQSPLP